MDECFICERTKRTEACEYCYYTSGKSFNPDQVDVRRVISKVPDLQLPVRDEPLEPFVEMANQAEEYILQVRDGLNPPIPRFNGPRYDPAEVAEVSQYPLKKPILAPDYLVYGNQVPGIETTGDLLCSKTLLLVDPDWGENDNRYSIISVRCLQGKKSYLLTLNRHRALHGKMKTMENLYLVDEVERIFATYEAIKYCSVKVMDYDKVAHGFWLAGLQLFPIQETSMLDDFHVFSITGPHAVEPPSDTYAEVLNTKSTVISSHHIQMAARPRPGEEVLALGSRPALLNSGSNTEFSILYTGVLTRTKPHYPVIPPFDRFCKMSPSSKMAVGRVYAGASPNMITPNLEKNCTPVVRVDDGPIMLVKHEDRTHTTVFIPKEEGPFVFYFTETRPLRADDSCRFSVAFNTYCNSRVKVVGYAHSAFYSEYSGHEYVITPRLIITPYGSIAKKAYLSDEEDTHFSVGSLRATFPELSFTAYKTERHDKLDRRVIQVYITSTSLCDKLQEYYRDQFQIEESLYLPVEVFVDMSTYVLPRMHNVDRTPVVPVNHFFDL